VRSELQRHRVPLRYARPAREPQEPSLRSRGSRRLLPWPPSLHPTDTLLHPTNTLGTPLLGLLMPGRKLLLPPPSPAAHHPGLQRTPAAEGKSSSPVSTQNKDLWRTPRCSVQTSYLTKSPLPHESLCLAQPSLPESKAIYANAWSKIYDCQCENPLNAFWVRDIASYFRA